VHRTRGSFGGDTGSGATLLLADATRAAAVIGACALCAVVGFALGGLLRGRNGSHRHRLASAQRLWFG
jgi:hypothetical protein